MSSSKIIDHGRCLLEFIDGDTFSHVGIFDPAL